MSIHAQLTPEAQAKLAAQQRNSTISSVVISALVLVLMAMILYFIFLAPTLIETSSVISYQGDPDSEEKIEQKKINTNTQRKPSAPSSSMAKVIASSAPSNVSIPVPENDTPDPSTDFGMADDFGDGWGDGDEAGGGGFAGIPSNMKKRCSKQDRMDRLQSSGGTPECEDAVVKGLDYLKATQAPDGSWTNKKVAMTGLALLAYLGHCETPLSEDYGDSVTAAISYLVDVAMKNDGKMANDFKDHHWCYDHAIAAYALAEANTFCSQLGINLPNLQTAMERSADWIAENQHDSGGWEYGYETDTPRGGDVSVAAWHVQALKAAKYSGWKHDDLKKVERKSLAYIEKCQHESGGVGYSGPHAHGDNGFTLAGAGALCYQMLGKAANAVPRKACNYIDKESKFAYDTEDADLYQLYYNAQAMINRGGKGWQQYNDLFRDGILDHQDADGSWKNPGGGNKLRAVAPTYSGNGGYAKHYRTCLCILTLEVYYRFLPGTGKN